MNGAGLTRCAVGVASVAVAARTAHAFDGGEVIASNDAENQAASGTSAAPAAPAGETAGAAAGWPIVAITVLLAAVVLVVARRRSWLRLPSADPRGDQVALRSGGQPLSTDVALWFAALFLLQLLAPAIPVGLLQGSVAADTLAGRATLQWLAYAAQLPFAVMILLRLTGALGTPLRAAATGALALACAAPVILAASQIASIIQQVLTSARPDELGHETLRVLLDRRGDPWAWAVIAAVTIGAPILEEIAYRGGLHGLLRSLGIGPWATVLLASVFFVVMHLGMIPRDAAGGALAGLFALSILLGLLRERTGGLVAPIVAHALFNAANLILAWLLTPAPL